MAAGIPLKPGSRLRSAVDQTEVVVVRGAGEIDLRCGGEPMVAASVPAGGDGPKVGFDGGTLLGKRYVDDGDTVELLCVRGGPGTLSVGDRPLEVKSAKPLPASD